MSQEKEKAIELLEKTISQLPIILINIPTRVSIEKALAKLRKDPEQPIASEFTTNMRLLIKQFDHLSRKYSLEICDRLDNAKASHKDLLAACENSPAANMFSLFADFAEECFTKPSMAVYRNQFTGLATFLRSCVDRAEKMEAAIAKAKKE